jgi:3-phosphoshikimate 1-carboxyvinyltransferase
VTYPDTLEMIPLSRPPSAAVEVPGSKSITNRALVLAALTARDHPCLLRGALYGEDTLAMIEGLRSLGFLVQTSWDSDPPTVTVLETLGPLIPASSANLFIANSGTTMRFLTALVSLGKGNYRLDGSARMRQRPIADLLSALQQLGVQARSEQGNGCPPVIVQSTGLLRGGIVRIKGDVSSQFISALLMIAHYADNPVTIELEGSIVSEPYVEMTAAMMKQWQFPLRCEGGVYLIEDAGSFYEREGWGPERVSYDIEPDASAASYYFAASAITEGRITVLGFPEPSLQGDVGFVDVLESMGCRVERCSSGITVHGRPLRAVDVDMNAISDTVMTLAAVACFAEGPTTIRNVAHIRHKETDRISALATELRKVGAEVTEFADGLEIVPRPLHGAAIDTYNDHRMAMSMALIGLKVSGIVINNPGCVAKTYPGFFTDLEKLRN